MRGNQMKSIRSIDLIYCKEGSITDRFGFKMRKKVADSELLRIVEAIDADNVDRSGEYVYLPGIISVNVDVRKSREWDKIAAKRGILRLIHEDTGEIEAFKRLIVGSGHVRTKRAMFVRLDLWDQVNEILLCGLDKVWSDYPIYQKGAAKWNAYYGLAYTDSIAVDTPHIVVIPDFERAVTDRFDVVSIDRQQHPAWEPGNPARNRYIYNYSMQPDVEKTKPDIMPFDGAGLVSVECAKKWAQQLGCDHIPASFQFRAIPGFKGNLYTYDLQAWGSEHGWIVTDVQGKEHDIREEKIDAILTKSQAKFLDLYGNDISVWKDEFQKSVSGYTRTFNISEYSETKLKNRAFSSYQHLQTINFPPEDIETYIKPTIDWMRKVNTSIDAFLKYRHVPDSEDDPEDVEWKITPPYYKVAAILDKEDREILFGDPFIQQKMKDDLKSLRNRALSGKEVIHGNYQTLTPDLYGLAQYAFMSVADREKFKNNIGLLKPMEVYSRWWQRQKVEKIAIVRNPHIAMEARIIRVVNPDEEMKRWFKYQTTGIVTDSFSTLALALGTADFDGDHVLTTDSPEYLRAVERALAAGDGRTVDCEMDNHADPADISDPAILMESDWNGYSNNIGSVVNKVTKLWSSIGVDQDHDTIMKYIAITDIIGQLTIDAAKTGDFIPMDKEIGKYLRGVLLPHFMRYLKKYEALDRREKRAIETEIKMKGNEADILSQSRFCDADTNVNRVSHAVERHLNEINTIQQQQTFQMGQFLRRFCTENVAERSDLYKRVKSALLILISEHSRIVEQMRESSGDDGTYDYFYDYARYALLSQGKYKSMEKVLNILIYLSYADPDTSGDMAKSILWNAFEKELLMRAERKELADIDLSKVERRWQKVKELKKKRDAQQTITASEDDLPIHFSDEARRAISSVIRADKVINDNGEMIGKNRAADLRKLMLVLTVLAKRNMQPVQIRYGSSTGVSYSTIADFAEFNDYKRKQIPEMLGQLEKLGLIRVGKRKDDPKITVNGINDFADCENALEGELGESKDYKKICETLLWRFRWK